MSDELRKLAEAAIGARAKAADSLAVEYADLQRKSMEAHRAFLGCVQPDDIVTLTARVAELEGALKPRLSKEARALLEELCEAAEATANTAEDRKEAAALRLLLEWHDRAAAAMEGK